MHSAVKINMKLDAFCPSKQVAEASRIKEIAKQLKVSLAWEFHLKQLNKRQIIKGTFK